MKGADRNLQQNPAAGIPSRLHNLLERSSEPLDRLHPWLIAAALFAISLFVYTYKMQYRLEGQGGDTLPAQLMPITLLHEGNLDFNEFFPSGEPLPYPFHVVNGRVLSVYPILPGIVNTPVYWVANTLDLGVPLEKNASLLSAITGSIVTSLSVGVMFIIFRRIGLRSLASIGLSLLYAFGTGAWSTASRGIWQHGPALLWISAAIMLIVGTRKRESIAAAFFCGLAVINRAPDILIVGPLLLILVLRHPRLIAALGVAAAAPVLAMRLYSFAYYGSALYPSEYPIAAQNTAALRGNALEGLAGLLVSPSRGLLIYTPVLVFAVTPFFLRRLPLEETLIDWSILGGSMLYILLHARWYMWWGGTSYGYRVLIDLLPGLFILLGRFCGTTHRQSKNLWLSFLLFAVLSVYAGMLGGRQYPCGPAFENRLDGNNPWLWSIEDSDLVRCTQKLLRGNRRHGR